MAVVLDTTTLAPPDVSGSGCDQSPHFADHVSKRNEGSNTRMDMLLLSDAYAHVETELYWNRQNAGLDITDAKLDNILKRLGRLDAIELTLRDMSSRLTRAEMAVEKLQSEAHTVVSLINKLDAGFMTLNESI